MLFAEGGFLSGRSSAYCCQSTGGQKAALGVQFGGPFCKSRRMPTRKRRLTAILWVSHTPRESIGFPILHSKPEVVPGAAKALQDIAIGAYLSTESEQELQDFTFNHCMKAN